MKRMVLAVVVCAVLLAVAACGGASKQAPTPLASPTVAALPTPASTPATEQPSPPPTPTPSQQPSGRLFVYTREVRIEQADGRRWPTREVVTYDIDQGQELWAFEYGGLNDYPVGAELAGRKLVIATEPRVVVASLDGRSTRALLEAGEGKAVRDVAVSPNGALAAIAVMAVSWPSRDADLRLFDVGTGVERLVVPQDSRFEGFRGRFRQLAWRDDGRGVLVMGATGSEAPGGLATVFLDGTVRVEQVDGYGNVSPTGRMRAGAVGNVGCMAIAADELVIRDLDSGKETFRISAEGKVYSPLEWAPDGSAFVYIEHQWDGNCESLSFREPSLFQVSADGGTATPVVDLGALHELWYGPALVTADCDRGNEPVLNRWLDQTLCCYSWNLTATLRLAGEDVGKALHAEVVGFVDH